MLSQCHIEGVDVILFLTLKALPHQWVTLDTAILQSLLSKMLTSVNPIFLLCYCGCYFMVDFRTINTRPLLFDLINGLLTMLPTMNISSA